MKLRYLKQDALDRLRRIGKDKSKSLYCRSSPWLSDFFEDEGWFATSRIEIPGNIQLLMEGDDKPATDLENAKTLHRLLGDKLTPVQASDSRLWTYLCHETCWKYMKWRWPPIKHGTIQDRYFLNGNDTRALTRNGIARLWWFAHITYDKARANPFELTEVFLKRQNLQHNFIERSFGRNRKVLRCLLEFVRDHPSIFDEGNTKAKYERLGKMVNIKGGVMLLDCMTKEQLHLFLEEVFEIGLGQKT